VYVGNAGGFCIPQTKGLSLAHGSERPQPWLMSYTVPLVYHHVPRTFLTPSWCVPTNYINGTICASRSSLWYKITGFKEVLGLNPGQNIPKKMHFAHKTRYPHYSAFQCLVLLAFAFVHEHEGLACLIIKGGGGNRIGLHCVYIQVLPPHAAHVGVH